MTDLHTFFRICDQTNRELFDPPLLLTYSLFSGTGITGLPSSGSLILHHRFEFTDKADYFTGRVQWSWVFGQHKSFWTAYFSRHYALNDCWALLLGRLFYRFEPFVLKAYPFISPNRTWGSPAELLPDMRVPQEMGSRIRWDKEVLS